MGFLGSDDVVECSATDLVGEYVGQTGPKVVAKFDEALGQVLFIDEAYRLGEGAYAKDAVDEVVDCLTKERYKGKMLVILAGYEEEINRLLSVNPGLSSRFPEEIMFQHLTPTFCVELLTKKLQKNDKLGLDLDSTTDQNALAEDLFSRLSQLSGWGNGRDIETLASRVLGNVLKTRKPQQGKLDVTWSDIIAQLTRLHAEREQRAANMWSGSFPDPRGQLQMQQRYKQKPTPSTSQTTSYASTTATVQALPAAEEQPAQESAIAVNAASRDPHVSDATWQQLQSDRALREREEAAVNDAISNAKAEATTAASHAEKVIARAKVLEKQASADDEARRLHEAMRLRAVTAKQKADEEALKLEKLVKERQRAQQQERKAQEKLRQMGLCEAGFRWIKQSGGYRCAGGSHFVRNEALF